VTFDPNKLSQEFRAALRKSALPPPPKTGRELIAEFDEKFEQVALWIDEWDRDVRHQHGPRASIKIEWNEATVSDGILTGRIVATRGDIPARVLTTRYCGGAFWFTVRETRATLERSADLQKIGSALKESLVAYFT